ncbi:MAG: class I SAM-dependent methyltransferase [Phenylobacterium sp.]|uniref:class I SAM-dependent methyltransferase n=1 Tax=Phenylobacterium sp. TaxID=1871053 RepID=UPI001A4ACDA4|nr:class I SAM-dependent methyltransferase [Phenylobacterium sp.]MBL8555167.1 class I SAM-dependent methyltransferase [Phenylobacterium sp.]
MTSGRDAERETLAADLRRLGAVEDLVVRVIERLGATWPPTPEAMAADVLLIEALKSFPVFPEWFERRMTAARRRMLFAPETPGCGPLLAALAIQCLLNEHAWMQDAGESARVEALAARGADLSPEEAMALACYRPLADLPAADALLAKGWSGPVAEVIAEHVSAVREERVLAAAMPAVTPIREGVSSAVQGQYEVHPYPRWRRAPRMTPARRIVDRPAPVRPQVLVAGCGTGRQAIQAHEWLAAERTVAVDLSRRSLAYAARKTREEGVTGIEYLHGDILELPRRYPETFDVVTCVGVLHHMSDPFEGARAVTRTLKPGGLLNLGLYSSTARSTLRPAQALAARDYTPATVRELRQAIFAAPEGDVLRTPAISRDFYATSGARDLLMHVQEHQMGFADLRRMLDENGLKFLSFIVPDETVAAYRAAFPHDPQCRDLSAWEQFESQNPRTFARMYMFWAEKPAATTTAPGFRPADGTALGGVEDWKSPAAREAVRTDLRRGARATAPRGQPAIVHLRANWPASDAALAGDDLLAEVLRAVPVFPYWLEGRLTAIRRRLLLGNHVEALRPLLPALAIQCFLNEYCWAEDAIERHLVARLAARVADLTPDDAMILACYRPLADVPGAEALLARGWSGGVADVLREQLVAVLQEGEVREGIPALTPIGEGVSAAVRGQYEANPYPRWQDVTPLPPIGSILGWPIPDGAEVLFAGCGTGHHAIHAGQRYGPNARVLAIDLSRASLAYALRKTREAGIANIEYAQADLLALGALGRTFDAIESSGVLHHLADPSEGVRVLAGLLRPGGIMKLGLYSRIARAPWGAAKALARTYTPETIRELRQAIVKAPEGDPVREAINTTDFYATSSLRDLLMHVNEHELDVADLQRLVSGNGLEFMGFTLGPAVLAAYRAAYPHDPKGLDLANWDAFERSRPATFRGMYQFWVRKPG